MPLLQLQQTFIHMPPTSKIYIHILVYLFLYTVYFSSFPKKTLPKLLGIQRQITLQPTLEYLTLLSLAWILIGTHISLPVGRQPTNREDQRPSLTLSETFQIFNGNIEYLYLFAKRNILSSSSIYILAALFGILLFSMKNPENINNSPYPFPFRHLIPSSLLILCCFLRSLSYSLLLLLNTLYVRRTQHRL